MVQKPQKNHEKVSIIIPFLNEAGNLSTLYEEIVTTFESLPNPFEIIFINDGSSDGSVEEITQETKDADNVTILHHASPQGKGAALQKGIHSTTGDIIMFMDADLQDDPADIPKFLKKLDDGYDLVNGWRWNRQDNAHMKTISSIGNRLLWRYILQTELHDMNCGFKAFRKDVLKNFVFYGDNYRFIPYLVEQNGYNVSEVKVHNRMRKHGKSKYGPLKMIYGLFDTMTTYFIIKFAQKPFHFFGSIGAVVVGIGVLVSTILTYQWYFYGEVLHRRPLLLFAMLLIIIGVQFFLTGIVAELYVYLEHKYTRYEQKS